MTVSFRPATRENVRLLIGLAGGTGSGKTFSAMKLAKGMSNGARFALIDTENGRASHYADQFDFDVADITSPFRPKTYLDAIKAADDAGYPVTIVDSMSHEWEGVGGLLEWHDELQGGDQKKNLSAWIKPKGEHRTMVNGLLQVRGHVILCFRAAEKVETKHVNGKIEIVAKESLTGLNGWLPISEKNLPYELTASFLLTADAPGVPKPIKLQEQHRAFVKLDMRLGEGTGARLAAWAAGRDVPAVAPVPDPTVEDEAA